MHMLLPLNNKKRQPLVKKKRDKKCFTGNILFSMDVAIYRPTEGGQEMVIRRRGTSPLGFDWRQWLPVISVSNRFM